jgi:phycocyanobilin lyase subunit beta
LHHSDRFTAAYLSLNPPMSNPTLAQDLIRAVEAADSAPRLVTAVENLAAAGLVEATPHLIAALNYNNPGAAVAAVDGLILIGKPAVQPLLELIDDYNYGARAWAIRALASIGDPRSLPILLESAVHDFALSVRRAAARGLGTLRWPDFPPEQVAAAQAQALTTLFTVTQDPEWVVRYAAITGLQAIASAAQATNPALVPQIIEHLIQLIATDVDRTICTRSHWAMQQLTELGMVSAAAIATLAETLEKNSANALENAINPEWRIIMEQLYRRKFGERIPPEGDPQRFRATAATLTSPAPAAIDRLMADFDYLSKVPVRGQSQ